MVTSASALRVCLRVHLNKIGRTEPIRNRLNAARILQIRADDSLHINDIAGSYEQCGEMSARRTSLNADARRVEIILRGVGSNPSNRSFGIVNLRRKNRLSG